MSLKQFFERYRVLLLSAGLAVLTLAAFEPIRHNEFITLDDGVYITDNPHIQSGITFKSIIWAFTTGHQANWHPLTWLSHILDVELFGLNPLGHHLHNLVLHIINTILLFWVLQKMTGAIWPSAFAAMAFGLHPLHVESVAWAAERKDVLCALFWMLTMAAYLKYARRGGFLRYVLVILCFALGLMAKPMIVTLPIVLLILDFWPLGRMQTGRSETVCGDCRPMSLSRLIAEKIPLFLLVFASCIITYLVQQKGGAVDKLGEFPLTSRIANVLVSYMSYLYKTVLPKDLAVPYPYPFLGWPLWKPVAAFLLLISISGFVIYHMKKRPYLLAGWLWYIVTLIPVIGLVQIGVQTMADRYMYLPSVGIFIMISWAAAQLTATWRYRKMILGTLAGVLIIAMISGTRTQAAYWKDSKTLNEHTETVTKDFYLRNSGFGGMGTEQMNKLSAEIQEPNHPTAAP